MKKFRFISVLLLFTVFIPKVYAFTYDLETTAGVSMVAKGTVKQIKVSLKEVQGVVDGFGACTVKISFDEGLSLNGNVKASNGWTVLPGNIYSFDTSESFVSNAEMFVIPVKINNAGSVKLTNIECSDGETKEAISDKIISFTVSEKNSENSSENVSENDDIVVEEDALSTNISEIILSEGDIDFDPDVTEYTVTVSDFEKLDVSVVLESSSSSYDIKKNIDGEDKNIIIKVVSIDESSKVYTIKVLEEGALNKDSDISSGNNNDYVPIFIGIICILVLVNIFRIVRNRKK